MNAKDLKVSLKTDVIGNEIFCYESVLSTNDTLFDFGLKGWHEGLCVLAEYQERGKGRQGRSWVSPKGKNLLLSVLLKPQKMAPTDASKITLTAAVSVIRAIHKMMPTKLGIKWPNDIVHQDKKIGGILTEMREKSGRIEFVVVGIGVNVNAESAELPPHSSSLYEISGHPWPRHELLKNLLEAFETDYRRLTAGDFEGLARDWEEFSATSGKRIAVSLPDRKMEGRALGIDADGALWLRHDNGLQERILAADIQHLR